MSKWNCRSIKKGCFGKTVRPLVRLKNGLKSSFIIYSLTVLPVLPKNNTRIGMQKHVIACVYLYIYVIARGFLVRW